MRTRLLTLARIGGVPIVVSPSWVLIALLLMFLYGPLITDVVDIDSQRGYLAAFGFSLLFGLCILAHELGHTLVSTKLGYPVKRVVLFFLGGVSEIEGEPRKPSHEFLIAGSGPLVSVLIAAAAFGGTAVSAPQSVIGVLLALLAWSNVVLAIFNLLPGLPLDGGRLLRAVVWACGVSVATSTKVAAWAGRGLAVALAVATLFLTNLDGGTSAATVLTLFLALYLWVNATQSLKLADLMRRLPRVHVPRLLRPGLLVPGELSVAEALRRVHESGARGLVLVDAAQQPSAIVDERRIGAIPPDRQPWTPVSEVARPLGSGGTVPLDIDPDALLHHMQDHPATEYLVVDADGAPAGIIATADFARELRPR